ncbi:MAG: alpha/beta fold hydrolase, partial [Dehalococcoidia bacterium]
VRTKIAEDFRAAFAEVDFIVTPTAPTVAFELGEKTGDPLQMYLNDYCTVPMSLAGIPAISIPCGLSDGRFTTLGYREALDLLGAVDYLRARLGDLPIGVLGISMGAVAAIMAAAECPHIKAMVVDSAYADLESAIGKKLADFLRLPFLVSLGWVSIRVGEWFSQGKLAAVRVVDCVGRFAPRPLLIIYGELDDYLPSDHPQRLFDAANEPKELWLAPGSGHAMARLDHPQEYVQRVQAFFGRYLPSA